jgi:hypothetical protein
MNICYLECDESLVRAICKFPLFAGSTFIPVELPITATFLQLDVLVLGPKSQSDLPLAASIPDGGIPPVALFILPHDTDPLEGARLEQHPQLGRSLHFCKKTVYSITFGFARIHTFAYLPPNKPSFRIPADCLLALPVERN